MDDNKFLRRMVLLVSALYFFLGVMEYGFNFSLIAMFDTAMAVITFCFYVLFVHLKKE